MPAQPIVCHKCGHAWTYEPPLERRAECPQCGSDARVCRNCRHFDTGYHHECREEQAEWVREKDRGNFCSYFAASAQGQSSGGEAQAKAKLDQLFGGSKGEPSKPAPSLQDELARFLKSKS